MRTLVVVRQQQRSSSKTTTTERVGVGEAPKILYINYYTSQPIAYLEQQRTRKIKKSKKYQI